LVSEKDSLFLIMTMKKFIIFCLTILLISCSQEINVWCGGHENVDEGSKKETPNLIVNVGDSKYGTSTRSVVMDSDVTSGVDLKEKELKLYSPAYGWYSPESQIYYGSSRGYLFAESSLSTPYSVDWKYTKFIDSGSLVLSAEKMTGDEEGYYYPIPVLFWGNYDLVTSEEDLKAYQEIDYWSNENSLWKLDDVDLGTKTIAISRNIQYSTSVFKPIINVSPKIKVYSDATGKHTAEVNRDQFKFTVQYFYVNSSSAVTYGEDFKYTPTEDEITYKFPLKNNGVFGDTENGIDVFKDWSENYANLTILPTSKTKVQVVLVCKYFGNSRVYIYSKKSKSYTRLSKGDVFYIYGNINSDSSKEVVNPGNALCPRDGSFGVFIPDVRTTANIQISSLVSDIDGDGENDPVVVDPGKEDIIKNTIFNVDVEYGDMTVDWEIGK
jgi:hypothetical protein